MKLRLDRQNKRLLHILSEVLLEKLKCSSPVDLLATLFISFQPAHLEEKE